MWFKATLRPLLDASYENEHSFYLRLKDLYSNKFPEDTAGGYDHDGPHVDYSYLVLDFRPLWIEAGRRYFKIGRGIAYSDVNDGVQINYLVPGFNAGAFASQTLPHEDNIDTSVPGYLKDSDRHFYGAGVGYTGIRDHQIYSYVLVQRDFSDEEPNSSSQQYTYNSQYYGVGSVGKISKNVNYWIEIIREEGKSYVYTTNEEKDVDAWATDIGMEYKWKFYGDPKVSVEYAYGSGDPDRTSVTDTENGNALGNDNNFLYFGYFPTGIVSTPRLSNLHLYKISLACFPLKKYSAFEKLSFAFDYYRFFKDRRSGGISDEEATQNSRDVGSEIDFTIDWQAFSDLNISIEFGHFMPGDAFPSSANNNENYFSVSSTITF